MQCELTNSYEAQPTPLRRRQPSWEHTSISTDAETVRYRLKNVLCPFSILQILGRPGCSVPRGQTRWVRAVLQFPDWHISSSRSVTNASLLSLIGTIFDSCHLCKPALLSRDFPSYHPLNPTTTYFIMSSCHISTESPKQAFDRNMTRNTLVSMLLLDKACRANHDTRMLLI